MLTGNEDSTATVIDQTLLDQIIANSRTSSSDTASAGTGSSSSSNAQKAPAPRRRRDTTAFCAGLFPGRLEQRGDGHQHCRGHELFGQERLCRQLELDGRSRGIGRVQ